MAAKRAALLCLLLVATACFAALGVWQVERRTWKLDLIARVEARIHAPPAPIPLPAEWEALNERDDAYRTVRVEGVFLHECETPVQALTSLGAGYWIMTPLRTRTGTVLVNRGFVPEERRDPATRAEGQTARETVVTGLLRMTEPSGAFLRANDPANARWYSRDAGAIARACGVNAATTFFVDADSNPHSGGFPVGGLTMVAFRNSHLVYAITWFALAAMSAGGAVLLLRPRFLRRWTDPSSP